MHLHVVTSGDEPSFAAALATINSVLQFHPDALIRVVCSEGAAPTPAQRRLFAASNQVNIAPASWPHAPTGSDKARACRDFGDGGHVVAWIDQGGVLCSPIVDVAGRCLETGGLATDSVDDPTVLIAAANPHAGTALAAWADGARPRPVERLDARLWCPQDEHWRSIIDFRDGEFVNVSSARQRQRMFCSADPAFWLRAHRDRVLDGHALQTYPYLWFLAMVWFGRCADWSTDPVEYLPPSSRHLFDDLIFFLPQIVQVLPRARHAWSAVTNPMITRALDGIPRMLALDSSMSDVIALVALHPWIRRYVEVGCYEGGSILTLALRFLARDIDFYAVESFTGNLNGTTDGAPLPSRTRFLEHLSRFPGLRVRLVPGDSAHAAVLFDDDSLDCVFIDGCHDTPAVLRDIDVWLPKLRRPAIIAGDDYNFDSVFDAVHQRFDTVNITRGGAIWWVSLT
jgi:hypothetical protein